MIYRSTKTTSQRGKLSRDWIVPLVETQPWGALPLTGQYAYARTARVPFWPISVPQRVGFQIRVGFPNFVPLGVGVLQCRPRWGIHFLGEHPPPPRNRTGSGIPDSHECNVMIKLGIRSSWSWSFKFANTLSTCLTPYRPCEIENSKKKKRKVENQNYMIRFFFPDYIRNYGWCRSTNWLHSRELLFQKECTVLFRIFNNACCSERSCNWAVCRSISFWICGSAEVSGLHGWGTIPCHDCVFWYRNKGQRLYCLKYFTLGHCFEDVPCIKRPWQDDCL